MIEAIATIAGAAIQAGGAVGVSLIGAKAAKDAQKREARSQLLLAMAQERAELAAQEAATERARDTNRTAVTVVGIGAAAGLLWWLLR